MRFVVGRRRADRARRWHISRDRGGRRTHAGRGPRARRHPGRVNDQLPGFGFIRPDGTFGGFDIDFGRALAAAIFGDATAVQFVGVSASNRFEALRAREIDVLIRNTTWTLTRPGRRRSSGCRMSGRVPRRAARTRWSSCRTPSRRNRWRQSPAPTMRDGRTSRYREQPE
jgi:hypothetical protein